MLYFVGCLELFNNNKEECKLACHDIELECNKVSLLKIVQSIILNILRYMGSHIYTLLTHIGRLMHKACIHPNSRSAPS